MEWTANICYKLYKYKIPYTNLADSLSCPKWKTFGTRHTQSRRIVRYKLKMKFYVGETEGKKEQQPNQRE